MNMYAEKEKDFIESTFEWLHAHPELGLDTIETGAYVAETLRSFGYEVIDKVGGNGVLGIWDTGVPGPVFALRADMDCLLFEVDGKEEKYHACGHDAHSTMLLTTAKILKENNLIKKGKLVLVFQPAEENDIGARAMIQTGLLNDIEEMVGMHVAMEEMAVGEASPAFAHGGCSTFVAEFTGKNAHASTPQLGVNATEIAVAAVEAVKCIHMDPTVPHSCKATKFSADGASSNTIPDKAVVYWDVRSQTNEVMDEMQTKMEKVVRALTEALGAQVSIKYNGAPAANNHPEMIELAREVITEQLGKAGPCSSTTGSEDFHFFSCELGIKTTYIQLGAGVTPYIHAYGMTFDHKAMIIGTNLFVGCAVKRLG